MIFRRLGFERLTFSYPITSLGSSYLGYAPHASVDFSPAELDDLFGRILALKRRSPIAILNSRLALEDLRRQLRNRNIAHIQPHPLGLELRLPPYFSLAITEVLFGGMQAHRIVGLAFHVACALALLVPWSRPRRRRSPACRSGAPAGPRRTPAPEWPRIRA